MSRQLTPADKKKITSDWQGVFPRLGIYKPMWLLKRHGPLLVGLVLDRTRSNDVYIPTFHVHNLLVPSPAILLSLVYPVPDVRQPKLPRQIKVSSHTEEYLAAAAFLKQATPELEVDRLVWARVVDLHSDFLREKRDYAVAKFCSGIFRDVILLAYWCGHIDYARQCLLEAEQLMRTWTPSVDVVGWRTGTESLWARDVMERTLASEIARHKLTHIPVFELDSDGAEAGSITETYRAVWN